MCEGGDANDPLSIGSLETPIDYLAVTFIVSLVGFPVLILPARRG